MYESDCWGKMVALNLGIRPRTVGPRMIPPSTSEITLGCRSLERMRPSAWVTARMSDS